VLAQRVMLLEAWQDFERNCGDAESLQKITEKMPRKIKKKRLVKSDDGVRTISNAALRIYRRRRTRRPEFDVPRVQEEAGWEEYFDYIFPDEEQRSGRLAILEKARAWKKQRLEESGAADE
jgi:crooked neck